MEYRQGSHTRYKIEYHFVWVTKYLYAMLVGNLVSASPDISPSTIMRRMKGRTSRKLFEEFPQVRKRYWGQNFWARGCFCVTAGELTKEMIQEYLSHHFEPKPHDGFDVEP
jgi:putative transposase